MLSFVILVIYLFESMSKRLCLSIQGKSTWPWHDSNVFIEVKVCKDQELK